MRRFFTVLLGLVLLGGAVASFGYRWLAQSTTPSVSTRGALPSSARSSDRSRAERPQIRDRVRAWDGFQAVVEVANLVVGLVGIWLAVAGMRMQRAAARRE